MHILMIIGLVVAVREVDSSCLGKCCQGRDDLCIASVSGKLCFCDEYCLIAKDCCSDYVTICGACSISTYASTHVKGHKGLEVRVHEDFKGSMNAINGFAENCDVTVMVTSAYRKSGEVLQGAIVTPAVKSNHFVGHAIDFNLQTPTGWCNSICLQAQVDTFAKCFIEKVKKGGLRWGGDFTTKDPVHIDDGLNLRDGKKWDTVYKELQKVCREQN